jgi:citrate lyase subunit beta / citryl-CoA lyase
MRPDLLRSALYLPASNPRALAKARGLDCDAVILDLEDAVAPEAKVAARDAAVAALREEWGHRTLVIRVNAPDTAWGRDDLGALCDAGAAAVLMPKVGGADDLLLLHELTADAARPPALWAMIETCRAVLSLDAIAQAAAAPGSRLACLVMGANDLLTEMRAEAMPDRANLVAMLAATVAAARSAGLAVLDGVWNALEDADGLARECAQGRALGFDGKTLIHPNQIAASNAAFAPSDAAVADARAVVAAFDDPASADKGAIRLNGRMVERLHLRLAQATLARADLIAARAT